MVSTAEALTAVLPLRVAGARHGSDLDRALRFLFPSFELYWQSADRLKFLVIVPPTDRRVVKRRLASGTAFPVRVLSEDVLCPTLCGSSGWHKQQILKLVAAEVVPSPWYLTLDADVILKRPASLLDLFPGGKPVFKQLAARYHWDWWLASSSILGGHVAFDPTTPMMGVTPEILRRDVAIELVAEIGRRHHTRDPQRFLFDARARGWTEYSLYWLFVLESGLDHLYAWGLPGFYEGIWSQEQAHDPAHLDHLFGPDCKAFFLVLQSNLGLPLDDIQRLVEGRIPLKARHLGTPWWRAMFGR